MASLTNEKTPKQNETTRTALGAMSVKEIKNALHAGKRVSVMLGSSDLKRGDKEVAWIGAVLAEACEDYHVDVAVGNMPGLVDVGLEIVRRIRRIEDEGVPYGVASNVEALGSKSPYRGVDLGGENINADALAAATAEMEPIIWNQNVWPVLIQLTDQNTMLGFLAGHEIFPHDEGGRSIPVDAAVAFLGKDGNMSCGHIRSFRDEAYSVIAEKLAMHRIDIDEEAIPFVLEEARKRKDADVIAHVAEWFENRNDIKRYLELAIEAAELGSAEANFWLGHEYLSGENLPRDYEKAYSCFIKGKDVDWVPIDPEENAEIMDGNGGEVTAETLLRHGDIDWWLFLLEKHPTRAVKCGLADWYMKQGGDENREKALKLLEESANEGFEFAFFLLIKFYSEEEFKDIEKGKHWFYKAEEYGFDESVFADRLGVESLECRKLKDAADNGDRQAAGKLACAYLHGGYGDCLRCPKDKDLARHYGILASAKKEGVDELIMWLDDMSLEDRRFLSEVTK